MLCRVVLPLVFAAASANPTSPETLRESRTSEIRQTLRTFNLLNDVRVACEQPKGPGEDDSLYCHEPIRVGDGYAPLKTVVATEMDEIRRKLTSLLALETKAVACRGVRYLLPIIMYGLFVDSLFEGNGIGGANIFPELYAPVESEDDDDHYDYDDDSRGEPVGETVDPKGSVGDETRAEFVDKIAKLVRVVRLFARDDGRLNGVDEAIASTSPRPDARSYRRLLLRAFRAVNGSYRAECFPGYVDTTALLAANRAERDTDRKIRALVAEAGRAFATARDDFAVLCVKFFPVVRPDEDASLWDVPVLYYQVFNKYRDPDAWPLIGDEIVRADGASSTTLGVIVPRDGREIEATAERLARYARNAVKCRCLVYVNLMTKLYANAVRALLANESGIRRLRTELQLQAGGEAWFGGRTPRTEDELRVAFHWYHGRMKGFRVDGLRRGLGDADDDVLTTAADDVSDHAFTVYSKYYVWSIGEAVDAVACTLDFLGDVPFETQLTAMLCDMEDALRHDSPKRQTIAVLTKWRELGDRAYRDDCLAVEHRRDDADPPPPLLAALNDAMRMVWRPDDETAAITLEWIVARVDDLNKHLEDDLRMSGRFKI